MQRAMSPSSNRPYVDVLLPGFIEANSAIQAGIPCLNGTRIPFYVGLGWVWEGLNDPKARRLDRLTREQIIGLAAFHAGYEWHRSRKRRRKMDEEVRRLWDQVTGIFQAGDDG